MLKLLPYLYFFTSVAFGAQEITYDSDFQNSILPFWESGNEGFADGVASVPLRYKTFVNPNAKATIVISHGYSEDLLKYRELIFDFYQGGYSVVAFEHRGHGASGRIGKDPGMVHTERFDHYVEDLKLIIETIAAPLHPKTFLFCHSMGAGIAARYLLENSNHIKAAVLSAPMIGIRTGSIPTWISEILSRSAVTLGAGQRYVAGKGPPDPKKWVFSEKSATGSKVRFEYYKKSIFGQDRYGALGGPSYVWLLEGIKGSRKILEHENLASLKIPIYLPRVTEDRWVRPEQQDKFCEKVPNCRLQTFEGGRHELYLDRDSVRNPYLDSVLKFFNKNVAK